MQTAETVTQTRRHRREAARIQARRAAAARTATRGGAAIAASGLIISGAVAANASDSTERELTTVAVNSSDLEVERASEAVAASVTASTDVELSFDRPVVSTEGAPEAEPEPVAEEPSTTEATVATSETATTEAESETPAETTQQATQTETATATDNGDATAASTQPAEAAEPAAPATGGVVSTAYSALGTPYVWAGSSLSGMDCSGFINWVYRQHGVNLPRNTHGMLASLPRVSTPQPGDIVISTGIRSSYHAGIYVGNGQMIGSLAASGVTQHGYHEGWHNVVAVLRPM